MSAVERLAVAMVHGIIEHPFPQGRSMRAKDFSNLRAAYVEVKGGACPNHIFPQVSLL